MVGLSPALGAFLAGVVLAESEFRRELETDIEPFRGLLLGLFFITVGAGIDLRLVASQPLTLIGLVLGLMVLKFAVMFGLARLFGAPARGAAAVATALAQGGEFAFVLLTFTVGAGVIGATLAALLTAAVAVSMALTPVAMILYERIAQMFDAAIPKVTPDTGAFDDSEPDIIIAGFGRFGQITGRLLTANGFRSTVLDSDIEQIDLLRRFGRRVHYGDATRMDLLRAAGIERARMLIVALDDREKTVELVETARKAFPDLVILARAWDRRHAYDLLANGADAVERETFEAALALGTTALQKLGYRARPGPGDHRPAEAGLPRPPGPPRRRHLPPPRPQVVRGPASRLGPGGGLHPGLARRGPDHGQAADRRPGAPAPRRRRGGLGHRQPRRGAEGTRRTGSRPARRGEIESGTGLCRGGFPFPEEARRCGTISSSATATS